MTAIVVIAKPCLPGRVKTRLTPPFSPEQAATLAAACLDDTLAVVRRAPVNRRILFFGGGREHAPALAEGFEFVEQPGGDLDARLGFIFDAVDEPLLLVGMDTPQLTLEHIDAALHWPEDGPDTWFGPATDGGFWALGMRRPDGSLIRGVPMSVETTGREQLKRLRAAGLSVGMLDPLTDVDRVDDARAVAEESPRSRFAHTLAAELATLEPVTR